MGFKDKLIVAEHNEEGTDWILVAPLTYIGAKQKFTVPKDFITDFASTPKMLWGLYPPYGKHTKAAVVHDFLYRTHGVSRKDADGIFRRMMKELGVGYKRHVMYRMVRWFGRRAYNRRKDH